MTDKLRLKAETDEDVTVISAALQDAITRVGDISYDASTRVLFLRLTRFRHEGTGRSERILCGLRIDGVLGLKSRGIEQSDKTAMAVLLSVHFTPSDAPGGILNLIFAGGGEIKAVVECVDMSLADVTEPRATDKNPLHPDID